MKSNQAVFHYAVIRFMPFTETREFANIGVVVADPKTGIFLYKLAPRKFSRVTQFFEDIDGRLYRNAIEVFDGELKRLQCYFAKHGLRGKEFVERFNELTRRRESVVHFSETGRIFDENASTTIEMLFKRFVARDFATRYYREQHMVKTLREKLSVCSPAKFIEKNLQAGLYDIKLPLVHSFAAQHRIIKPLALTQQTPLKAMVHGETWINHIKRLVKNEVIQPEHVLFTVEKPAEKTDILPVYNEIVREIDSIGVHALDFSNLDAVIDYTRTKLISSGTTH